MARLKLNVDNNIDAFFFLSNLLSTVIVVNNICHEKILVYFFL